MAQELARPRVTEIQVRMDCNGCVQKIKKALHGVHGIYDLYIDFPQQKITIVGSADPEKIVKAIKKTRKSAIVCSHIEQTDPQTQQEEPAPADNEAPPPESSNSPPTEAPPAEEPPKEPPKDPPTQENEPADEKQTHEGADNTKNLPHQQSSKPTDVEEVHVIYHYPPDYGYRHSFGQGMSSNEPPREYGYRYNYGQNMSHEAPRDHSYSRYNYGQSMTGEPPRDHGYIRYSTSQRFSQEPPTDHGYIRYNNGQSMNQQPPREHGYRHNYAQTMIHEPPQRGSGYRNINHARPIGPEIRQEAPPSAQTPVYVSHSYNSYQPSPYVTGYEYIRSPPRYTQYTRPEHYSEDYHYGNNGNGTISSVFSDENPNACTIS